MPRLTKLCACGCGVEIDKTAHPRKKYSSDTCRARAAKRKTQQLAIKGKNTPLTPAMQRFRELRESEDDYVRDVLQDVVRDLVTEAVHDNVLGAAEVITGLLPLALASLADDMQHGDDYIRSKARGDILKYAFDFKKKEGKQEDFGQINILTGIALPDTPLGQATAEAIITIEEEDAQREVEAFEQDWPQCARCKDRKHPDALHLQTRKDNGKHIYYCSSCRLAAAYGRKAAYETEESGGDDESP
jgi:hypothetical protein